MYWSRTGSELAVLGWLLTTAVWWLGGWALATHAFRLVRGERLLAGFGLGLAGWLWAANLLAHWLAPSAAFLGGALLVAAAGLVLALSQREIRLDWRDLEAWPLLGAGLLLGWLFLRVSQGLAIFDDYMHLPLISTMAAGNIPPQYFVNSPAPFAYHYGFQLLGASLMRLADLHAWSAFDLSKAILWAYTLLLAYLVGMRYTRRAWGGVGTAALLAFAGGTRYLLLLLPANFLSRLDALIDFKGAEAGIGVAFSQSLVQGWPIDGGPPIPYTFGFLSGISRPLVIAHAGLTILNAALFLLVWLLYSRPRRTASFLVLAVLLAFWGLTWETSYGLFVGGVLLAAALRRRERPLQPELRLGLYAALLSVPVVLLQGGLLTELAAQYLTGLTAPGAPGAAEVAGFGLRWPPAVISAHLGALPVDSWPALVVALFELGPVVLFTPWLTAWAWKRFRSGEWIFGALILSAWAAFALPLVVTYLSETDLPRISEYALSTWIVMLGLALWQAPARWGLPLRYTAGVSLGLMCFGGVMLAGTSLTAASQPIISYRIGALDALAHRELWDRLPPDSEVFDPQGWRATALTGRLTRSVTGDLSFGNQPSPQWLQLRKAPAVQGFLDSGYPFVYFDDGWWQGLSPEQRSELKDPCVEILGEYWDGEGTHFRRMLDLRGCA